MKLGPLLALTIALTPAMLVSAQEDTAQAEVIPPPEPRRHFIYADLSLGVLALGYGYDVTDWLSLQLTAQYYAPWYVIGERARGVGGELRVVFVPFRSDEHALIVVPGVRAAGVFGASNATGIAYSLRASLGYQLTVDWFRLQIGFGFQHHALSGLDAAATFSGLYPCADLLVGVVL